MAQTDYLETLLRLYEVSHPYLPYVLAPLGIYCTCKILEKLVPGPQQQRRLNLKDRTVLITGASSGLGRALAFAFYRRGAKVILCARSIEKLKQLCEELVQTGNEEKWNNEHKPEFRYLDLADLQDDETAKKQLSEIKNLALNDGRIDVLVNNAGLAHRGTCLDTSMKVQRQIFDVNYFGQIAVTKAVFDSIPDDGAIVTIGSVQSRVAIPYRAVYSASKHALQAFMDALRAEERPQLHQLHVNAGYLNTGFGSRGITGDGHVHGRHDTSQLKGYSPEYAAESILSALEGRKTELLLAPFIHRLTLLLRILTPNLLWWALHKRGQKLRLEEAKQD